MKNVVKYSFLVLGMVLLMGARASTPDCGGGTAPEVDPSLAVGGITLLAGALAVLRSRLHR